MNAWLTIVGMGEDGFDGLSAKARTVINQADIIVGTERLLKFLPKTNAEIHLWPQPFSAVVEQIKAFGARKTVLLATGDPLNYGVARKILEFVPFAEVNIIPHLSAFSLAASRMGWSIPDCDCLTLHGRHAANIETFIQPNAKLLVLTADRHTVPEVCRRLVARGFGGSKVSVLEHLGGPLERILRFLAEDIVPEEVSDLNTLAIQCSGSAGARSFSRVAGLPDDAFVHDGQLTKREVRAATLAALAPAPDQLLWDVGAGCGSVAIEWMRSTRGCEAIAFEHNAERLAMIAANADALGTPRLKIIAGSAPSALTGHASPDAVFIGGGMGEPGVFEESWKALKPGGHMVANVVTLEGELHLVDLQEKYGGDLTRLEISHLTAVGRLRALRPRMAVLQWRAQKPW